MVGVLATIGVILAAAYMLWMYQRVVLGRLRNQTLSTVGDMPRLETGTLIALGIPVIWIGIMPDTFVRLVSTTTAGLVG